MPDAFFHTVSITASPPDAWPRLQVPETWAGIAGLREISNARRDEDGVLLGFSFAVEVGGKRLHGTSRRTDHREPELLEMAIDSKELSGVITIELKPVDPGSTLTVKILMKPESFVTRLAFPLISQTVEKGLPAQVEALARRLEGVEP